MRGKDGKEKNFKRGKENEKAGRSCLEILSALDGMLRLVSRIFIKKLRIFFLQI